MTGGYWFSAKLRYAVLTEPVGLQMYMDSVRLFRATDYDLAFRRVLDDGLKDEKSYSNADGQRVLWKLASIISLDRIGEHLSDGQEVYSEPITVTSDDMVPFEHEFHPEASEPTQTR
jgi:hypothetical protein